MLPERLPQPLEVARAQRDGPAALRRRWSSRRSARAARLPSPRAARRSTRSACRPPAAARSPLRPRSPCPTGVAACHSDRHARKPRLNRQRTTHECDTRMQMILAHLDLDAFFAAVEELEEPHSPLEAAGRGRRPARPRRCRDRELRRAAVRNPLGDELRRGAPPLSARGLHAAAQEPLPRVLERGLGRRSARSCRSSSGRGSTRATSTSASWREDFLAARALAEAVQASVRGGTSLSASLGVATPARSSPRWRATGASPEGLTVVPPGREAGVPGTVPIRRLPGIGPRAEERLHAAGIETIGALAALTGRRRYGASCRARSARCSTTARAGSTRARARDVQRDGLDQPRGDLRRGRHRPRSS